MIVTRNERYTDWVYQGVHMNEQAATHGEGLLSGHIYYRYSHDFLKSGEEIQREKSFIHLSDGSEYELGEGLSSEKIKVILHPLTSEGNVHLEVQGKPELGVGVQSIRRSVTIAYDDGKVPVLDTDQLNGIIAELHDSLSESMKDTAEAVKEELRTELNTIAIEVKQECDQKTVAAKAELNSRIDSETATLRSSVSEVSTKVDTVSTKVDTVRTELVEAIEDKVRIARWTFGQYSIGNTDFNNILFSTPTTSGDGVFSYSANNKSLVLNTPVTNVDRILRVSVITTLEIPNGFAGHLVMHIRNIAGGTQAQSITFMNRDHGMPQHVQNVFFTTEIYVPADFTNHPIYGDGFRVEFIHSKSGAGNVVLKSGSINLTLLTA